MRRHRRCGGWLWLLLVVGALLIFVSVIYSALVYYVERSLEPDDTAGDSAPAMMGPGSRGRGVAGCGDVAVEAYDGESIVMLGFPESQADEGRSSSYVRSPLG